MTDFIWVYSKNKMEDIEQRERLMEDVNMAGATSQQGQVNAQTQYYLQEQERGMAESQLECETTLYKIIPPVNARYSYYK